MESPVGDWVIGAPCLPVISKMLREVSDSVLWGKNLRTWRKDREMKTPGNKVSMEME